MNSFITDPKELALIGRVAILFREKGMKAMTMDGIAEQLHVSKKTLYKYVKNRVELVNKCVQLRIWKETENRTRILELGLNPIAEHLKFVEFTSEELKKTSAAAHEDLKKHFPAAFKLIQEFTNNFLFNILKRGIERGIEEGLYCAQLDPEIIARMYICKIDLVFNGSVFPAPKFNFANILEQIVLHHIRGMVTQKGMRVLEEITKKKFK